MTHILPFMSVFQFKKLFASKFCFGVNIHASCFCFSPVIVIGLLPYCVHLYYVKSLTSLSMYTKLFLFIYLFFAYKSLIKVHALIRSFTLMTDYAGF